MPPRLTLAYRLQGGIGRIGEIREEACGLEMWNGVRHSFSATSGRGGLGERAVAEGVGQATALLVRNAAEGNFMCVSTWKLKGCCFPELEALFNAVTIAIPF